MVNQVQVKNVYRNFGAVKTVDGVSIEIKKDFFSSWSIWLWKNDSFKTDSWI